MFNFLLDAGNYEQRKIAKDEFDWGFISTCRVSDGVKDFETAVQHKRYGGSMTIVENYDTAEEAAEGHKRWVKTMTAKKLPKKLIDCNNAGIAQFGAKIGCNFDKPLLDK